MSTPFQTEEQVAIAAVQRACTLTSNVFNKLVKNETLVKGDKSPVTGVYSISLPVSILRSRIVGDFAAQAVIASILSSAFPSDKIVGEEDASDLRLPEGKSMKDRIVTLANEALTLPLGLGDNELWGIGPNATKSDDEILQAIDKGNHDGGRVGRMSFLQFTPSHLHVLQECGQSTR